MDIKEERISELENGSLKGRVGGWVGGSPKGTAISVYSYGSFITNIALYMS